MKRAMGIVLVVSVALVLLYISRFWPVELWGRPSVLAQIGLRPGGGLLLQWLRGTPFSQFELLIWAIHTFAVLTLTERVLKVME